MATYSNRHWLLCHIRNSFISTDNTGMSESVMSSDDFAKQFLRKYKGSGTTRRTQQQRRSRGTGEQQQPATHRNYDPTLREIDFICYPGLDQSDDEDADFPTHSFDIQMYPELGAHRFRSNTAQKLEKMDLARRKAAKTKRVNYNDEIIQPQSNDFFVRKTIESQEKSIEQPEPVKSKLTLQLTKNPQQVQNKFQEYAKFDGTSQSGVPTKRINVFLSMLPEKERNYPIKICVVLSQAKISDLIGLVCYKASIRFADLPLKSIRHYGLYMTEDNDDLDDFPPLDHREPCSKFGFSNLTLAERKPSNPETRTDNGQGGVPAKSMTSEEEKVRLAFMAFHSLNCTGVGTDGFHSSEGNDDIDSSNNTCSAEGRVDDLEERILSQDDMLEAPVYRIYNLNIIDKKFFKTEVCLGISGERIEIDQQKNAKFWTKQRAVTYPIDAVAHCEIVERRTMKAVLRIWLKTSSSISSSAFNDHKNYLAIPPHSPTSPGHYPHFLSPFNFLTSSSSSSSSSQHIRFKHYDFDTTIPMAEQICKKLNCILDMVMSDVRKEFLQIRQRKLEKNQTKRHLKL